MFFQCISSWRERNVSPDTCAIGVGTHMTDVPALAMHFCVELHKRGATTLSSRITVTIKTNQKLLSTVILTEIQDETSEGVGRH